MGILVHTPTLLPPYQNLVSDFVVSFKGKLNIIKIDVDKYQVYTLIYFYENMTDYTNDKSRGSIQYFMTVDGTQLNTNVMTLLYNQMKAEYGDCADV